jgi:hypothetical protein
MVVGAVADYRASALRRCGRAATQRILFDPKIENDPFLKMANAATVAARIADPVHFPKSTTGRE